MVALNQTPVNPSFSTIPNPITANFTILALAFVAILLMNKQSYALLCVRFFILLGDL
jgi:hypothetical protein